MKLILELPFFKLMRYKESLLRFFEHLDIDCHCSCTSSRLYELSFFLGTYNSIMQGY